MIERHRNIARHHRLCNFWWLGEKMTLSEESLAKTFIHAPVGGMPSPKWGRAFATLYASAVSASSPRSACLVALRS